MKNERRFAIWSAISLTMVYGLSTMVYSFISTASLFFHAAKRCAVQGSDTTMLNEFTTAGYIQLLTIL